MAMASMIALMLVFARIDFSTWNVVDWVKLIIIIGGCIAVAVVLFKYVFEWWPPAWAIKIFWIVVACVVGLAAINMIASM